MLPYLSWQSGGRGGFPLSETSLCVLSAERSPFLGSNVFFSRTLESVGKGRAELTIRREKEIWCAKNGGKEGGKKVVCRRTVMMQDGTAEGASGSDPKGVRQGLQPAKALFRAQDAMGQSLQTTECRHAKTYPQGEKWLKSAGTSSLSASGRWPAVRKQ